MGKNMITILVTLLLFTIILLAIILVRPRIQSKSYCIYDIVSSEGHTFKLNKQTGEVSVLVFYDISCFVTLGDINLANVTDEDKVKFYKQLSENLKTQKALEIL